MSGLGSLFGGLFSRPVTAQPGDVVTPRPAGIPSTRAEAIARYGAIVGTTWKDQAMWMTLVDVPEAVGQVWLVDGKEPAKHIYCNKDVAGMLKQAMANLISRGLLSELHSFDGCFNIRNTRGSSLISAHAYGCAIDLNCDTNPLGGKPSLTPEFVKCWTDCGWAWGGNFHGRVDGMHFSIGF